MNVLRILIPTTLFSVVCAIFIYAVEPSLIISQGKFPSNIAGGVKVFLSLELFFILLVWPYGYRRAGHELKNKDYACSNCLAPLKQTIFQKNHITRNILKMLFTNGRATFTCVKCGNQIDMAGGDVVIHDGS
jgi:hypothetical protein